MSFNLPIDHVIILASDLAQAGKAFENIGFSVTPIAKHSAVMGTANRCVMLDGSYIEILAIVEPTEANARWRRLLDKGSGLGGVALRSKDIETDAQTFEQKSIEMETVRHFSRQTDIGELRFSISRVKDSVTPSYQCLLCQHHALKHPNGARRLLSVSTPNASELGALSSTNSSDTIVSTGQDRLTLTGNSDALFDLRASCGLEIAMVRA
jgi:hypothetical protein